MNLKEFIKFRKLQYIGKLFCFLTLYVSIAQGQIIIDHTCTDINKIPVSAINAAKDSLHIAYDHTSHGSQLITGMNALDTFMGGAGLYVWSEGGGAGVLDIDDYFGPVGDLGSETTWAPSTRTYLNNAANADVNVIMWSWCNIYGHNIQGYLDSMEVLISDYGPGGTKILDATRTVPVTFVFMTGHTNPGSPYNEWTFNANKQIRQHCLNSNRILYDFYDIECYDPDDTYFGDGEENAIDYGIYTGIHDLGDDCSYNLSEGGRGNWATEWQNSHTLNVDWYNCSPAHTLPLNGNRKAYAAWWLFARLAGWDGEEHIYIAQTTRGNGSGTDSANTHSVDWFNNANNWSSLNNSADGLISPGDTVHLCGTISSRIIIQGNGFKDKPITILFEENAKLSSPCFQANPGNHNDGAIAVVHKEYIVIDGGINGIIENTDTGTITFFTYYRTNQNEYNIDGTIGVCISESNNIDIKNMRILNLYQSIDTFLNPSFNDRYGDVGAHTNSRGILIHRSNNIHVLNNRITFTGFGVIANILENENIDIDNNIFSRCGAAIVSAGIVNHDNPSIIIHHNHIFDTTDWGYNDGMKFFGTNPDQLDVFKGIKIYNNIIGPDISTEYHPATAWIVADQGFIIQPEIYNNVFIAGPNDYNTGRAIHFIEIGGNYHITQTICPQNSKIYNNTIISESPNSTIGILVGKGSTGHQIYNNITKAANHLTAVMIVDAYSSIEYCDYNNYYTEGNLYFNAQRSLENWRAIYGFDTNCVIAEPQFVNADDPVGPDNTVFTTDDGYIPTSAFLENSGRFGNDIGAYDYGASAINPVTLHIKVFLEGPFNAGTMGNDLQSNGHLPLQSPYDETEVLSIPDNVVDWIQVELRTEADDSGENIARSVFLRNDGRIVDLDGSEILTFNVPEGNYYIMVKHRNHLAVMSSNVVFIK